MARERESSARMHSKFATRNERVRSLRVHGFIIAQLRDVRKCAVGVRLAVLVRCTKPSTARVNCPCCPLSGLSGLVLICEGPPVRRRFAVVGLEQRESDSFVASRAGLFAALLLVLLKQDGSRASLP